MEFKVRNGMEETYERNVKQVEEWEKEIEQLNKELDQEKDPFIRLLDNHRLATLHNSIRIFYTLRSMMVEPVEE